MIRAVAPLALAFVMLCTACTARDLRVTGGQTPEPGPRYSPPELSPEVEEAILALDPGDPCGGEMSALLSRAPAPRVINLNGSLPVVTMDSFSRFLIGMGYPEWSVRHPVSGNYSYSSYQSGEGLAGMVAWYYEKEGMMPILIGHSQGGMTVLRALYALADESGPGIEVRNPLTGEGEGRSHIIDPQGGQTRPVAGLRLGFASAIATGSTMRLLLGQWDMLGRLRTVPDTVEDFTGFRIRLDPLGANLFGPDSYRAAGLARVRDVVLPATYSHFTVVDVADLAADPAARAWIEAYRPQPGGPEVPALSGESSRNILVAAELWHGVRKHWCTELKRMVRTKRGDQGG